MIVVDANVIVVAFTSSGSAGDAARAALLADVDWWAPAHMPLEAARTWHRAVLNKRLAKDDADSAFNTLAAAQIRYTAPDRALLHWIWTVRHNVSAYDAAYLALAAEYDAPLVTFDARLATAAELVTPALHVRLLDVV